ncbi:MAG: phage holin family protein [Patescibacteria group bacterium]
MKKLLSYMAGAGLGLWIATFFIAEVKVLTTANSGFFGILINENWKFFILFGIILGLLNFFAKPVLDLITLPLRIITLGFFGLLINMGLIWAVDVMFEELAVPWFWPLLWTSLIIWTASVILVKLIDRDEN